MKNEPQETFGTGLRAYLGRLPAEEQPIGTQQQPAEHDAPAEPPKPLTPEELAGREQELIERERRFAEHIRAFEHHVAKLQRREEELREREAAAAEEQARASTERRNVREALREHAEVSLARIFQVFDDAMTASDASGDADHGVRLAAVRALLAEAYAEDGAPSATAAIVDELAAMRHRRTVT